MAVAALMMQTSCAMFGGGMEHFTPEQQKDLTALEQGLNNPKIVKYDFKQYGSFGEGSGKLYYHPTAIKMEYDDPKGDWALGKDEKLVFYSVAKGALSKWSLKHSPLKALLTLPVKLHVSGVRVTAVTEDADGVHLILESKKLLASMSLRVDYKIHDDTVDLQGLTMQIMSKKMILVLSNPQVVENANFSSEETPR